MGPAIIFSIDYAVSPGTSIIFRSFFAIFVNLAGFCSFFGAVLGVSAHWACLLFRRPIQLTLPVNAGMREGPEAAGVDFVLCSAVFGCFPGRISVDIMCPRMPSAALGVR